MRTNNKGEPGMGISHYKRDKSGQEKWEAATSMSREGLRAAMEAGKQDIRAKIRACLGCCGESHLLCI
jgi:hypothetical protein